MGLMFMVFKGYCHIKLWGLGCLTCVRNVWVLNYARHNRFPLIINDVPPPLPIMNIPGGQKLFIIRGEYLLKGFGRAAFKFLLKSIKIKLSN